jgi:hypothetical protein
MQNLDIKPIVDAARETANSIVGARQWHSLEDAEAIRDVIFWDMLNKRLPEHRVHQLRAYLQSAQES